jgi:RNA polymerase sigma factor (sigma-70 family)
MAVRLLNKTITDMDFLADDTLRSPLRTRHSLLRRVCDWEDATGWREFYGLYRTLIYGLARRSGLSHADADEVTQDVFQRIGQTIHGFECDPARGSFRGWLMNLTRWRIANKFARRPLHQKSSFEAGGNTAVPAATATRTIERIADQAGIEETWEAEWRRHLLDVATARLSRRVNGRHYQVFDLYVRQQVPVARVAAHAGMSAAAVYLVSHRLTSRLRREVALLREQLG